jgi:ComF family protein
MSVSLPSLASAAKVISQRLADLVVPRVCGACGTAVGWDGGTWCSACAEALLALIDREYCRRCGRRVRDYLLVGGACARCREGRSPTRFTGFAMVGRYDGPLRQMILRFKHDCSMDGVLGAMLADAVAGAIDPARVDVWVPVPAHWRRRWEVGFWPTRLLADAMVRRLGGEVVAALQATRYVAPFHERKLSATARAREIRGVFAVQEGLDLRGLSIGLVDDVMTTGATLGEARRTLRKAGAGGVYAAVVARLASRDEGFAGVDRGSQTAYTPAVTG